MALVPKDKKLRRLVTGSKAVDAWIDETVSAIERNSNITASGNIQAHVGPMGIHLALGGGIIRMVKTGAGGIGPATSTTMGKATVTLYDVDPATGNYVSQTITDDGYNLSKTAVSANAMCLQIKMGVLWVNFWEDC